MRTPAVSVFESYPQLNTLKGLIPTEIVEREISLHADEFEQWKAEGDRLIPTVSLGDVFPPELEEEAICLETFLGHWGNMSVEAVCKIALIVRFFKPRKVFEFGTYNGLTTLQMALNTPSDSLIYTLDLPPDAAQSTLFQLTELDRYVAAEFRQRFHTGVGSYFKGHPVGKKIVQILSDSARYEYSPFYGRMDLILIDAAHDYENKRRDSENALKMVSPNGLVLWDNYGDVVNPYVTKYLIELARQRPLFHLRGTPLVVYWNKP